MTIGGGEIRTKTYYKNLQNKNREFILRIFIPPTSLFDMKVILLWYPLVSDLIIEDLQRKSRSYKCTAKCMIMENNG